MGVKSYLLLEHMNEKEGHCGCKTSIFKMVFLPVKIDLSDCNGCKHWHVCYLCISGKSAYSCEVVNTYLVFNGYIIPKTTFLSN